MYALNLYVLMESDLVVGAIARFDGAVDWLGQAALWISAARCEVEAKSRAYEVLAQLRHDLADEGWVISPEESFRLRAFSPGESS